MLVGDTQHEDRREQRYALMLNSKEADGLIFLGHRLPEAAAALARAAAPRCAPIVNGCEFNPRLGIPSVHIDNARAASDAMHLLYDLGHERIGIITGPLASPLSRDRLRGATTTAKKRSARRLAVITGDFSVESGAEAVQRLLAAPSPPTAIFCFNDEMAMGVLDYARHKRIRVPRDLSVVGFDDIRFARYTEPALTTVAQPMRADRRRHGAAAAGDSPRRLQPTGLGNPAAHLDHPRQHRGSAGTVAFGFSFRLPASGFRLPASGFRLPASGFRLSASERPALRLPASGFRASGFRLPLPASASGFRPQFALRTEHPAPSTQHRCALRNVG